MPVQESFLKTLQAKTRKYFKRFLRKTLLRNNANFAIDSRTAVFQK